MPIRTGLNMYCLETEYLKLEITEGADGEDYKYSLTDKIRGRVYSDMDYFYGLGPADKPAAMPEEFLRGPIDPSLIATMLQPPQLPLLSERVFKAGPNLLEIRGRFENGLEFLQHFSTADGGRRLVEEITVLNTGDRALENINIDFGFRKMLCTQKNGWSAGIDDWLLEPLPTRRFCSQKVDRLAESFGSPDLLYSPFDEADGTGKPGFAAEGWTWGTDEARILINKYNRDQIELSRFRRFPVILPGRGREDTAVLFGGAAVYRGDPESASCLAPGCGVSFGKSVYTFFDGGWEDGALLYRSFLEQEGHGLKADWNPSLHWNELYNLGWFAEAAGFFAEGLEFRMYTREQLFREAELAVKAGAETLYLDPGWDTEPGSTVWDSDRMGDIGEFVRAIHEQYGLKLGLHLMMCFWSAEEADCFYWRDEEGRRCRDPEDTLLFRLCPNGEWLKEKTRRLLLLAEAGIDFFMFDFTAFGLDGTGCCCPDHGHEVPMRRSTHAGNIYRLMRNIKEKYPGIVIEAHDRIRGGLSDYHPVYFQDDRKAFDEIWGYEFMWNPLQDLLSGKALSLYEYNLSCPVPLYLHINSGCDLDSMLQFWWYASTVRHLGIGGIADEESQEFRNLGSAVKLYRDFRAFFSRGGFFGLEPLTHIHVSPHKDAILLTVFNLSGKDQKREIVIEADRYGVALKDVDIAAYDGRGGRYGVNFSRLPDGVVSIDVLIPPLSPLILHLEYS